MRLYIIILLVVMFPCLSIAETFNQDVVDFDNYMVKNHTLNWKALDNSAGKIKADSKQNVYGRNKKTRKKKTKGENVVRSSKIQNQNVKNADSHAIVVQKKNNPTWIKFNTGEDIVGGHSVYYKVEKQGQKNQMSDDSIRYNVESVIIFGQNITRKSAHVLSRRALPFYLLEPTRLIGPGGAILICNSRPPDNMLGNLSGTAGTTCSRVTVCSADIFRCISVNHHG